MTAETWCRFVPFCLCGSEALLFLWDRSYRHQDTMTQSSPGLPCDPSLSTLFPALFLLPYFCTTIMRHVFKMVRFNKFADMLPANFYIPD
jgi:hypothetical protein